MASFRRALPSLARCERPRNALSRAWRDQPGRLAQGPEEKSTLPGRLAGFVAAVMASTLSDSRPSVGRGDPSGLCRRHRAKSRNSHAADAPVTGRHAGWGTAGNADGVGWWRRAGAGAERLG